jgi:hypothetical protein
VSLCDLRRVRLKSWFLTGFFGVGGLCALVALIQLAFLLVSGTAADSGGWVLVLLLFVHGVWGQAFAPWIDLAAAAADALSVGNG